MALLACPFCREMFPQDERNTCPVCGVPLVAQGKLPLSDDALSEDGLTRQPEWDLLPITYLRRGRGPLALLCVLGLVAFFLPWVHLTLPDVVSYTGFDLGRRLGWAWGAGVAWVVLFPVVATRRTIMHMRGARVAASFLAAIPGVAAALLLARPPHGSYGVPCDSRGNSASTPRWGSRSSPSGSPSSSGGAWTTSAYDAARRPAKWCTDPPYVSHSAPS